MNNIKQITLSLKFFEVDLWQKVYLYTITVKSDGSIKYIRFNRDVEKSINSIEQYTIEEDVVTTLFEEVDSMIASVDPMIERYEDDCTGWMTITYENGKRVRLDRGRVAEGESIYYKVLKDLNIER